MPFKHLALSAVAVLCFVSTSCVKSPTAPTQFEPFSSTDLVIGTGIEAVSGQTMSVNYTGWLYDESQVDHKGAQFDSSIGTGTVYTFVLGTGGVIKGWDQGVPGMLVGGTRRLVIPPSLAYGGNRTGAIPPNSTLIFDIDLIDATDPNATTTTAAATAPVR
ncbi:MAG: FKBP-type peptidyl-prolyl cis-trans isomerase [Acidobacteriaceae bacterium]|nr:FKBP-type peptidyl-prolyl cis-trans isomerase [Acidobacteriaceae bacterium]